MARIQYIIVCMHQAKCFIPNIAKGFHLNGYNRQPESCQRNAWTIHTTGPCVNLRELAERPVVVARAVQHACWRGWEGPLAPVTWTGCSMCCSPCGTSPWEIWMGFVVQTSQAFLHSERKIQATENDTKGTWNNLTYVLKDTRFM